MPQPENRKSPEQVFTPRAASINETMYIDRPDLEDRLTTALKGSLHTVIHGDSGTGKSWLYKRVLTRLDAVIFPANLANASRLGSITNEASNIVQRTEISSKVGHEQSNKIELGISLMKAGMDQKEQFKIGQKEPLEACFEMARRKAGERLACIVLDNLESIFDSTDLMKELADIIVLLDDTRYSQYNVKLMIVGVPSGVKEYFSRTPNMHTISNRLYELPEVSRLTYGQAETLIVRGLVQELKFQFLNNEALTSVIRHISWVTDRVPQRIHEYCLEFARLAMNSADILSNDLLPRADREWVRSSLSHDYAVIESLMNNRETRVGRRNQVLYALGKITSDEIKVQEVEDIVRAEFPSSTERTKLNISGMLADLASAEKAHEKAIIKRSPKGDSYVFRDPKYRTCIRVMLTKEGETVTKVDLSSLIF